MSTPAKKVRSLAKQSITPPDEKATPLSKRARTHAETAAMRGEENASMEASVVEATPSKPAATLANLGKTTKKNAPKKGKRGYGDGEKDGAGMAPKRKLVGGKAKKIRAQKPAGKNVTKSKESDDGGRMASASPLSESSTPGEINENEYKNTLKKPVKRKKKVPKAKAIPETKRPKTEEKVIDYSLYLGNLNSAKDSEEIKKAIVRFFTKNNLTVCSVRISGTKKFGFANFFTAFDLEKALEMNGGEVLGMACNMKARNREGISEMTREREARTLFVKNLPYSTTPGDLQDVFTNAVNVRLPVRKDGSARGIAYLEFESEEEADKARKQKQCADVKGRPVILDYTGDKSMKRLIDMKTIVVSNISKKATESSIKEVFQKAISIRIRQHNNVKQKGVALVEFSTDEDAKEAVESSNKVVIDGLKVHVMLQGAQPAQTKTLFIRGLSRETTEKNLREAFDGAVGCRIATYQKTGECRGFGFVEFSSLEDASAAKEAMEGFEIGGNMVTLEFAKPKAEGSRGFGDRSENSKGGGRGGRGRGGGGKGQGGKKVVKGGDSKTSVGVEEGITGKSTGGKITEHGKEEIVGGGGKLGFGRGGERGARDFVGRMDSSRGGKGGKSGLGKGSGRGGSKQGKGGFGGRGAGTSKGRFGGLRGGLSCRGGTGTRGEQ